MGDNDFPAVMANGGEFLQGYTRKRGLISEQEEANFRVEYFMDPIKFLADLRLHRS